MPIHPALPYPSDIDYLTAEFEHVRLKSLRMSVERRLKESEADLVPIRGVVGRAAPTEQEELRRVLGIFEKAEALTRSGIDARLAMNRTHGPALGLDTICIENDLDDIFSRTLLLLSMLFTMGEDVAAVIDPALQRGFCGTAISLDAIWQYTEMPIQERIQSRLALAPLLKAGLIMLDIGRTAGPADIARSSIEITRKAFAKIVGVPELDIAEEGGAS